MIFRLTQKLSAKIKAGTLGALPLHDNPLADWSAHLFVAARTQYILLTNTKSLYTVVLHGKGITNESTFVERALSSIREVMQANGQGEAFEHCIAPVSASVQFAKSLNRSITGSMNDMLRFAVFALEAGERSLREIGVSLSKTPMSALTDGGRKYGFPWKVFAAMVSEAES